MALLVRPAWEQQQQCRGMSKWIAGRLTVHSVPVNSLAISAHRLPRSRWDSRMARSSSSLQGCLLIEGSRLLCHRSRHCLPLRPGSSRAIWDHSLAPNLPTNSIRAAWSTCNYKYRVSHWGLEALQYNALFTFCVNDPFVRVWLKIFVLPSRYFALASQYLPQWVATACLNISSCA